jgi:hypothetical protein
MPTGRAPCAVPSRLAAGVCSRAASAGSSLPGPRHAIAALLASRPHAAGAAGTPVNATAPRTTARNAAGTRAGVIACACGNGRSLSRSPGRRRLRPRPPARASAQRNFPRPMPASPASAPGVMRVSRRRRVRHSGVSVAPRAARRYGASANARSHAGNDDDAARGRGGCVRGPRPEFAAPRRRVLQPPARGPYRASTPTQREERVGRSSRSPVSFL